MQFGKYSSGLAVLGFVMFGMLVLLFSLVLLVAFVFVRLGIQLV